MKKKQKFSKQEKYVEEWKEEYRKNNRLKVLKCLNLGCGNDYRISNDKEIWVNTEIDETRKADKHFDHNLLPYPFKDNEFDFIYFSHTIEHLRTNFYRLFNELSRILKKGGMFRLNCPHFSHTFDFDHKSFFSYRSLVCLPMFDVISGTLHNTPENYFRNRKRSMSVRIFNYIVEYFANKNPYVFERLWCWWVGGMFEMRFIYINNKKLSKSVYKWDYLNGNEFW